MTSGVSLAGVLKNAPYLGRGLVWEVGEGRGVVPRQRDTDVGGEGAGLGETW